MYLVSLFFCLWPLFRAFLSTIEIVQFFSTGRYVLHTRSAASMAVFSWPLKFTLYLVKYPKNKAKSTTFLKAVRKVCKIPPCAVPTRHRSKAKAHIQRFTVKYALNLERDTSLEAYFLTVSPLCIRQLHPKSVYFSFLLCYNSDFQNCIMRHIYSNASRRLRASSSIWGLRAM